jgi:hypothetical protein
MSTQVETIDRLRAELADLQDGYSRLSRDFALAIESDSKHIAELAECREDAENWRAYAARKRAVIDAGMGKIILRDAARKGEGGGVKP